MNHSNPISPVTVSPVIDASSSALCFVSQGGTLKRNEKVTNEVWEYFRVYHEKNFRTHAFCLLCNNDVNYGKTHSTSCLEKHMRSKHQQEFKAIMSDRAAKKLRLAECEKENDRITVTQVKLTEYMDNTAKYPDCLMKWIYSTFQPLSIVENDSFRNMIDSLNKKAPIIGKDKL